MDNLGMWRVDVHGCCQKNGQFTEVANLLFLNCSGNLNKTDCQPLLVFYLLQNSFQQFQQIFVLTLTLCFCFNLVLFYFLTFLTEPKLVLIFVAFCIPSNLLFCTVIRLQIKSLGNRCSCQGKNAKMSWKCTTVIAVTSRHDQASTRPSLHMNTKNKQN